MTGFVIWAFLILCSQFPCFRYLRVQRMDGTVEYRDGDHTMTPAPNSWCFRKRKHFFKGHEYDNQPLR